jgi:hypothetical protein
VHVGVADALATGRRARRPRPQNVLTISPSLKMSG